jgi:membrane protease YdiL (CAAX protease family)
VNRLEEAIRRLPPGVEFLVVVTWAFGLPIFSSILSIGQTHDVALFTDAVLVSNLLFQMLVAAFLVWFLRVREWTLAKVGLRVDLRGTLWAFGLLAGCYALIFACEMAAQLLPIDIPVLMGLLPKSNGKLSMEVVFLASVVNGVFEELFVAGYAITALSQARGMWTAINVSTALRVLYHLYQGPLAFLTIAPMGLLFGYVYARTRQLWPLVLAHVMLDIVGLLFGLEKN